MLLSRALSPQTKVWQRLGAGLLTGALAILLRIFASAGSFSPDMTDEELIHLVRVRGNRDERPFQELMSRYQTMVWRTCYSMMHNPQDAEDLTQEVFFKAYRSLAGFEGRSSFKTWIYRIAINTCQNERRRRSRRAQLADLDIEEWAEVIPGETSLEATVSERRQLALLAEAISQLRPTEAEVIKLKDLEQRPYNEIASALGISLSAAKMRVQRARLALQGIYVQLDREG